jgi:hypothetical protein
LQLSVNVREGDTNSESLSVTAHPQNFTNDFYLKTLRERFFDGREGNDEFKPLMLSQLEGRWNFS